MAIAISELKQKLATMITETKRRRDAGYDFSDRMPLQLEIDKMVDANLKLTGGLELIYPAFIEMAVSAQNTFYSDFQTSRSNDQALNLLDVQDKATKQKEYFSPNGVRDEYAKSGGLFPTGRSPIDNTLPPEVWLAEDADRLRKRKPVMTGWMHLVNKINAKKGIPPKENLGQIAKEGKALLWNKICKKYPAQEYQTKYSELVNFMQKNPGADYDKHLLEEGIMGGHIKALYRDEVHKQVPYRYLRATYNRVTPLCKVINEEIVTVRPEGSEEVVLLRANEGHYLPQHGMAFTKWPNRTNEFPDFETLAFQASLYNKTVLVGRNSRAGSSIPQTAHDQLTTLKLSDVPHFAQISDPKPALELGGIVDIVQLGDTEDAFFLRLDTKNVYRIEIIEFINNLILKMQMHFNEKDIDFQVQIIPDDRHNQYSIIFIPFAALQKQNDVLTNPNTGKTNITEQVAEHLHVGNSCGFWAAFQNSPVELWKQGGRQSLNRLFDFACLPGTRNFIEEYVNKHTAVCLQAPRFAF